MRYFRTGDSYLVRLETGEEIFSAVSTFAAEHKIEAGVVSGIGSAANIVLGYYDHTAREYLRRTVPEEMEIVSLLGNISLKDGRAFPHLHVTLGGRDSQALAGHLFEGRVTATCELVIRSLPGRAERRKDEAAGLYLLDL